MIEHIVEGCQCKGKRCPNCDSSKCFGAFGPDKRVPTGLKSWCRVCDNAYAKTYYQGHKEQHSQTMQRIRKHEHHEEYLIAHRIYNQTHREQLRLYRETHAEEVKEYYKVWRQDNQDTRNILDEIRRTRKTQAGGSYTREEWEALKALYNYTCLRCGRNDVKLTADHIIPVAKNGTSDIDNIQPLCRRCNAIKGTNIIDYRRKDRDNAGRYGA